MALSESQLSWNTRASACLGDTRERRLILDQLMLTVAEAERGASPRFDIGQLVRRFVIERRVHGTERERAYQEFAFWCESTDVRSFVSREQFEAGMAAACGRIEHVEAVGDCWQFDKFPEEYGEDARLQPLREQYGELLRMVCEGLGVEARADETAEQTHAKIRERLNQQARPQASEQYAGYATDALRDLQLRMMAALGIQSNPGESDRDLAARLVKMAEGLTVMHATMNEIVDGLRPLRKLFPVDSEANRASYVRFLELLGKHIEDVRGTLKMACDEQLLLARGSIAESQVQSIEALYPGRFVFQRDEARFAAFYFDNSAEVLQRLIDDVLFCKLKHGEAEGGQAPEGIYLGKRVGEPAQYRVVRFGYEDEYFDTQEEAEAALRAKEPPVAEVAQQRDLGDEQPEVTPKGRVDALLASQGQGQTAEPPAIKDEVQLPVPKEVDMKLIRNMLGPIKPYAGTVHTVDQVLEYVRIRSTKRLSGADTLREMGLQPVKLPCFLSYDRHAENILGLARPEAKQAYREELEKLLRGGG